MRFYDFAIVVEKEPDDEGYSAYSPSLPGCFSNDRTIEEARRNMRAAIQRHVAALLAHAAPLPQDERLVHAVELSIRPLTTRTPQMSALASKLARFRPDWPLDLHASPSRLPRASIPTVPWTTRTKG